MNGKRIYRTWAALGAAMALVCLALVVGMGLGRLLADFDPLPLLIILAVAFAVACAANRIAAKVFARNHFGMPPEERQELIARHTEECRTDPKAILRRYSDMEMVPIFMLILYFLLALAIGVTGGMCVVTSEKHTWIGVVGMLVSVALLYMPLIRLFEQFPRRLNRDALVPSGMLPILQAMAIKAAEDVGVKGSIRLEITRDCDCDVNRIGKTYVVFLGTRLLSVLTQEEMQQSLIMAFDVFAHPELNRQVIRRYRLGMLGSADIRRESFAFDLFFSYADAYLEWEYEFYTHALKQHLERCAYERIRRDGDPRAAVCALAKKSFWPYFTFEYIHFHSTHFYKEPSPPKHFEEEICLAFRTACRDRSEAWLDMLGRQFHKAGDKDHLFREERELLDPDGSLLSGNLELLTIETPYGEEVMKAIREVADARLCQEAAGNYTKEREREYLEPLHTVEAYEKSPEGYSTPELSPIINGYRDLGLISKAEALCDAIMARETNQFALAHAIYFKGMCMIHRYETDGIDLVYRAIDLNKNYMQDGFEMVEDYCTLCGLIDEYATFRRRADIQMSAHAYNHEGAGYLVATDRLEREEELGDMLPDILGYMERVSDGCIRQVYLVRKVISEDFCTSAFVVNFEYGISEEQMRRTYSAIFNYLDAYPVDWQFSLFVYDRETERAVRQVEGSLVWEKK